MTVNFLERKTEKEDNLKKTLTQWNKNQSDLNSSICQIDLKIQNGATLTDKDIDKVLSEISCVAGSINNTMKLIKNSEISKRLAQSLEK